MSRKKSGSGGVIGALAIGLLALISAIPREVWVGAGVLIAIGAAIYFYSKSKSSPVQTTASEDGEAAQPAAMVASAAMPTSPAQSSRRRTSQAYLSNDEPVVAGGGAAPSTSSFRIPSAPTGFGKAKWVQSGEATTVAGLTLPGIELYAARRALVHTYSSEADLHKEGKVTRQIGYGDEFLPEVAESADVEHLVMVSIRGLVDAFTRGIAATLQDIKADEPRRKVFAERLDKMVHELPFTG